MKTAQYRSSRRHSAQLTSWTFAHRGRSELARKDRSCPSAERPSAGRAWPRSMQRAAQPLAHMPSETVRSRLGAMTAAGQSAGVSVRKSDEVGCDIGQPLATSTLVSASDVITMVCGRHACILSVPSMSLAGWLPPMAAFPGCLRSSACRLARAGVETALSNVFAAGARWCTDADTCYRSCASMHGPCTDGTAEQRILCRPRGSRMPSSTARKCQTFASEVMGHSCCRWQGLQRVISTARAVDSHSDLCSGASAR